MSRLIAVAVLALAAAGCSGTLVPVVATPTPFVAATPAVTPEPGRATIVFGTKVDDATLAILDPKKAFTKGVSRIAWSVVLNEPFGAPTLSERFASQNSSGTSRVIFSTDVEVSDPANNVLSDTQDLAGLAGNKAGTYALRILRGATVLAEGTFTLK